MVVDLRSFAVTVLVLVWKRVVCHVVVVVLFRFVVVVCALGVCVVVDCGFSFPVREILCD